MTKFRWLRTSASLIAFIFLFETVFDSRYASAQEFVSAVPLSFLKQSTAFAIPSEFGKIESGFMPKKNRSVRVFLIQDAHQSLEAQKKITGILEYLDKRQNLKAVLLEGTAGKLTRKHLDVFPSETQNRKLWNETLKRGWLNGGGVFYLQNKDVIGHGLESVEAYHANLETYRKVLGKKNQTNAYLGAVEVQLLQKVKRIHHQDLDRFVSLWRMRYSKEVEWDKYFASLFEFSEKVAGWDWKNPLMQADWPALIRIHHVMQASNARNISKVRNQGVMVSKMLQTKHGELASQLRFLLGRTYAATQKEIQVDFSIREFAENLMEALASLRIRIESYPELAAFIGQLVLEQEIDPEELWKEMTAMENDILKNLVPDSRTRQVVDAYKSYLLMKEALSLELTREQSGEFLKWRKSGGMKELDHVVGRLVPGRDEVEKLLPLVTLFYKQAALRESDFVREMGVQVKELRKSSGNQPVSIAVIAGGYHSEGLEKALTLKGVPFWLIRPNFSGQETELPYQEVLLGVSQTSTIAASMSLLMEDAAWAQQMTGASTQETGFQELVDRFSPRNASRNETRLQPLTRRTFLKGALTVTAGALAAPPAQAGKFLFFKWGDDAKKSIPIPESYVPPERTPIFEDKAVLDYRKLRDLMLENDYVITTTEYDVIVQKLAEAANRYQFKLTAVPVVEDGKLAAKLEGEGIVPELGTAALKFFTGDMKIAFDFMVDFFGGLLSGKRQLAILLARKATFAQFHESVHITESRYLESIDLLTELRMLQEKEKILEQLIRNLKAGKAAAAYRFGFEEEAKKNAADIDPKLAWAEKEFQELLLRRIEVSHALMLRVSPSKEDDVKPIVPDIEFLGTPDWLSHPEEEEKMVERMTKRNGTYLPSNHILAAAYMSLETAELMQRYNKIGRMGTFDLGGIFNFDSQPVPDTKTKPNIRVTTWIPETNDRTKDKMSLGASLSTAFGSRKKAEAASDQIFVNKARLLIENTERTLAGRVRYLAQRIRASVNEISRLEAGLKTAQSRLAVLGKRGSDGIMEFWTEDELFKEYWAVSDFQLRLLAARKQLTDDQFELQAMGARSSELYQDLLDRVDFEKQERLKKEAEAAAKKAPPKKTTKKKVPAKKTSASTSAPSSQTSRLQVRENVFAWIGKIADRAEFRNVRSAMLGALAFAGLFLVQGMMSHAQENVTAMPAGIVRNVTYDVKEIAPELMAEIGKLESERKVRMAPLVKIQEAIKKKMQGASRWKEVLARIQLEEVSAALSLKRHERDLVETYGHEVLARDIYVYPETSGFLDKGITHWETLNKEADLYANRYKQHLSQKEQDILEIPSNLLKKWKSMKEKVVFKELPVQAGSENLTIQVSEEEIKVESILSETNVYTRQTALDHFLKFYTTPDDQNILLMKRLIFEGTNDVSRLVMGFLREQHALKFLIQVWGQAVDRGGAFNEVAQIAYEFASDLLEVYDPDGKDPLSLLTQEANADAQGVIREEAERFFSVVLNSGADTLAGSHLLRSHFWDRDEDLKRMAQETGHPLYLFELARRRAFDVVGKNRVSSQLITNRDAFFSSWLRIPSRIFQAESDQQADLQSVMLIHPEEDVFDWLRSEDVALIKDANAEKDAMGVGTKRIPWSPHPDWDTLADFQLLSPGQQQEKIVVWNRNKDYSELVRVLKWLSSQRVNLQQDQSRVLNDCYTALMNDPNGRLHLAQHYLNSDEDERQGILNIKLNSSRFSDFVTQDIMQWMTNFEGAVKSPFSVYHFHLYRQVLLKLWNDAEDTTQKKRFAAFWAAMNPNDYWLAWEFKNRELSEDFLTAIETELSRRAVLSAMQGIVLDRFENLSSTVGARPEDDPMTQVRQALSLLNAPFFSELLEGPKARFVFFEKIFEARMGKEDNGKLRRTISDFEKRIAERREALLNQDRRLISVWKVYAFRWLVPAAVLMPIVLVLVSMYLSRHIYSWIFKKQYVIDQATLAHQNDVEDQYIRSRIRENVWSDEDDEADSSDRSRAELRKNGNEVWHYLKEWNQINQKEILTDQDINRLDLLFKVIVNHQKLVFQTSFLTKRGKKSFDRRWAQMGSLASLIRSTLHKLVLDAAGKASSMTEFERKTRYAQMDALRLKALFAIEYRSGLIALDNLYQLLNFYPSKVIVDDVFDLRQQWKALQFKLLRIAYAPVRFLIWIRKAAIRDMWEAKMALGKAMTLGNQIEPNLFPQQLINRTAVLLSQNHVEFLQTTVHARDDVGRDKNLKVRRLISRIAILASLITVPFLLATVVFGLFGNSFQLNLMQMGVPFMGGFMYMAHIWGVISGYTDDLYNDIQSNLKTIMKQARENLLRQGLFVPTPAEIEVEATAIALQKELSASYASVDVIAVIQGENQTNEEWRKVRRYLEQRPGSWIRKDAKIIFVDQRQNIGDLGAYLSARQQVKYQVPNARRVIYLHAQSGCLEEIRWQDDSRDHPFNMEPLFRTDSVPAIGMLLAVLYRDAQADAASFLEVNASTHRIPIGRFFRSGNINLKGVWQSQRQVVKKDAPPAGVTLMDYWESPRVLNWHQDPQNVNSLRNFLKEHPDEAQHVHIENDRVRQLSVSSRELSVSVQDPSTMALVDSAFTKILNVLLELKLEGDLEWDFLVPVIRSLTNRTNSSEVAGHVNARVQMFPEGMRESLKEQYRKFYSIFESDQKNYSYPVLGNNKLSQQEIQALSVFMSMTGPLNGFLIEGIFHSGNRRRAFSHSNPKSPAADPQSMGNGVHAQEETAIEDLIAPIVAEVSDKQGEKSQTGRRHSKRKRRSSPVVSENYAIQNPAELFEHLLAGISPEGLHIYFAPITYQGQRAWAVFYGRDREVWNGVPTFLNKDFGEIAELFKGKKGNPLLRNAKDIKEARLFPVYLSEPDLESVMQHLREIVIRVNQNETVQIRFRDENQGVVERISPSDILSGRFRIDYQRMTEYRTQHPLSEIPGKKSVDEAPATEPDSFEPESIEPQTPRLTVIYPVQESEPAVETVQAAQTIGLTDRFIHAQVAQSVFFLADMLPGFRTPEFQDAILDNPTLDQTGQTLFDEIREMIETEFPQLVADLTDTVQNRLQQKMDQRLLGLFPLGMKSLEKLRRNVNFSANSARGESRALRNVRSQKAYFLRMQALTLREKSMLWAAFYITHGIFSPQLSGDAWAEMIIWIHLLEQDPERLAQRISGELFPSLSQEESVDAGKVFEMLIQKSAAEFSQGQLAWLDADLLPLDSLKQLVSEQSALVIVFDQVRKTDFLEMNQWIQELDLEGRYAVLSPGPVHVFMNRFLNPGEVPLKRAYPELAAYLAKNGIRNYLTLHPENFALVSQDRSMVQKIQKQYIANRYVFDKDLFHNDAKARLAALKMFLQCPELFLQTGGQVRDVRDMLRRFVAAMMQERLAQNQLQSAA